MSSGQNQQFFAEYSLWNDSAYSRNVSLPLIQFAKPVYEDSIFLAPAVVEPVTVNNAVERDKQPTNAVVIPWYIENFYRKTQDLVKREDLFKDPDQFYDDEEEGEASSPDEGPPSGPSNPVLAPGAPSPGTPAPGTPTPGASATGTQAPVSPALGAPAPIVVIPRGPANIVQGKGQGVNVMQRRLQNALALPARMDRGASMLQRMGWEGGGLGRDGDGITEPIAPNTQYQVHTHLGLGAKEPTPPPAKKTQKRAKPATMTKEMKETFKTNILLSILEFVKNDLQSELLFDVELKNSERRKIHMLVAALNGEEDIRKREDFDNFRQFDIVREIHERNNFVLGTQSEGDPPNRQICIYKEAQDHTYLVTPEDIRHTVEEEETNPFLKSITKHLKASDRGFTSDTPILDKLIKFFIEFSHEEYTEFRFLGQFKVHEVEAIGVFLGFIACLSKNKSLVGPEDLQKAFEKGIRYSVQEDINGYATIKKINQAMEISIE